MLCVTSVVPTRPGRYQDLLAGEVLVKARSFRIARDASEP
jgi:hypothetical protein